MRIACWINKGYKHILRICNTYCSSTATVFARTWLDVTSFVHWLSCCLLPTWCTDYYLFIKYYFPLHVSSLKCSSAGGYRCIHAAYGTVTLYERQTPPHIPCNSATLIHGQLAMDQSCWIARDMGWCLPLVESDSTICCMYTSVSSCRWALEARNMWRKIMRVLEL